jgi:hypothetical protein
MGHKMDQVDYLSLMEQEQAQAQVQAKEILVNLTILLLVEFYLLTLIGNITGVLPPPFLIYAKFDAIMGGLLYELLDTNGNTVQRIEKFFPVPPVPSCNEVKASDLSNSL